MLLRIAGTAPAFRAEYTNSARRVSATKSIKRTAERIDALLRASGRFVDPEHVGAEAVQSLFVNQPALGSCYQAASAGLELMGERAGKPSLRLMHLGAARVAAPSALCSFVRESAVSMCMRQQPSTVAIDRACSGFAATSLDHRSRKSGSSSCRRSTALHDEESLEGRHARAGVRPAVVRRPALGAGAAGASNETAKRATAVYAKAHSRHPERWTRDVRRCQRPRIVKLQPDREAIATKPRKELVSA